MKYSQESVHCRGPHRNSSPRTMKQINPSTDGSGSSQITIKGSKNDIQSMNNGAINNFIRKNWEGNLNYLPQIPRFDLVDLAISAAPPARYKLGPKRKFHQHERQLIIDIFMGMGVMQQNLPLHNLKKAMKRKDMQNLLEKKLQEPEAEIHDEEKFKKAVTNSWSGYWRTSHK